jgi:hypothetical protein
VSGQPDGDAGGKAGRTLLGSRLPAALDQADASPVQRHALICQLDLPELWRPGANGTPTGRQAMVPRTGFKHLVYPGHAYDTAPDASRGGRPDGPRELHRWYSYTALSMMVTLGATPSQLGTKHGFSAAAMEQTLAGRRWGRASTRRAYLQALVLEGLEQNLPLGQLLTMLRCGAAPQGHPDPVLHLHRGQPRHVVRR